MRKFPYTRSTPKNSLREKYSSIQSTSNLLHILEPHGCTKRYYRNKRLFFICRKSDSPRRSVSLEANNVVLPNLICYVATEAFPPFMIFLHTPWPKSTVTFVALHPLSVSPYFCAITSIHGA